MLSGKTTVQEWYFTLHVKFQMTIKWDWVAESIKSVNLIQTKKKHSVYLAHKRTLPERGLEPWLTSKSPYWWLTLILEKTFNPSGLIFDYLFKNFIDIFQN